MKPTPPIPILPVTPVPQPDMAPQVVVPAPNKSIFIVMLAGLVIGIRLVTWFAGFRDGSLYFLLDPLSLQITVVTLAPALGAFFCKAGSKGYKLAKIVLIIEVLLAVAAVSIFLYAVNHGILHIAIQRDTNALQAAVDHV